MSAASSPRERFDSLFEERVNVRAIAVLRVMVAPLALWHLYEYLAEAAAGRYFADTFFVPFFEWWPVPSIELYRAFLVLGVLSASLLALGLFTRLAAIVTLAVVSYNVLCNQLHFHHNRAFLMTLLFGLALLPSGRLLSIDELRARRRGIAASGDAPRWQLVLFRFLACTPYVASGTSKLLDPDWFGGIVMRDRIVRYRHLAEARGVPASWVDFVAEPALNAVLWKLVVLSEISIGVALWFPRTHAVAIWMALGFHLLIEATSQVQLFSFLGVAATVLWVVPSTGDRLLELPAGSPLERVVRRLDWLHRFDVREGPRLAVTDRDGTMLTGAPAKWLVLSRLPLLAPLALPRWWWHRGRLTRSG